MYVVSVTELKVHLEQFNVFRPKTSDSVGPIGFLPTLTLTVYW